MCLGSRLCRKCFTSEHVRRTMNWNSSIVKLVNCTASFEMMTSSNGNYWSKSPCSLTKFCSLSSRFIRAQQIQRESLQRDYVYLLQTSLSTEEGRLFGGTKVRDHISPDVRDIFFLLNLASRTAEGLTEWVSTTGSIVTVFSKVIRAERVQIRVNVLSFSLEGSGLYVDSYGFKHDKSNENDRLQYICVKLTQFYHSKAQITDEQVWRTLLKSYQNSSTIPVSLDERRWSIYVFVFRSDPTQKSFKTLVRQGIPSHLRAEFWHTFISKQTQQMRKDKGSNYFQNLCHLLPNSDVSPIDSLLSEEWESISVEF